jgi:DNA invertase Pin-like site-specific DNA recombinase
MTVGSRAGPTNVAQFQQLLADVENGLIDVIVLYRIERLSRSLKDFAPW